MVSGGDEMLQTDSSATEWNVLLSGYLGTYAYWLWVVRTKST
jgi:hypothetical protein